MYFGLSLGVHGALRSSRLCNDGEPLLKLCTHEGCREMLGWQSGRILAFASQLLGAMHGNVKNL